MALICSFSLFTHLTMSSLNLLVSLFVVVTVVLRCAVAKNTKTPPNGKPGLSVAVLKNLDAVRQAMQARGQSANNFGDPSMAGHFSPPPHCIPPELFNQNVSEIFFNQSLTRAEVKQELAAWAAKQNATVQVRELLCHLKGKCRVGITRSNFSRKSLFMPFASYKLLNISPTCIHL